MRPPLPILAAFVGIVVAAVVGAGAWHVFIGIPGVPPLDLPFELPFDVLKKEKPAPAAPGPDVGVAFSLIDQDGKKVTEADFSGRYMMIYFGYTFCPDMCPNTLSTIAEALDMLDEKGKDVVPVLISVDPARDTPEQLKMYVGYFHPRQVGLTGSAEQVAAVAKAYKVFFAKARQQENDPEDYLMEHTSATFLVGPDGKIRHRFSHGTDPETMVARLKELL